MGAIYDAQPVGFVLTFDEPSEGYFLWRYMIAQGHQRRGIGRRAMQQVLEHWRELGVTAARTSVVSSNTGATRLYASLGFRLTGEEDYGELVMVLDMRSAGGRGQRVERAHATASPAAGGRP